VTAAGHGWSAISPVRLVIRRCFVNVVVAIYRQQQAMAAYLQRLPELLRGRRRIEPEEV